MKEARKVVGTQGFEYLLPFPELLVDHSEASFDLHLRCTAPVANEAKYNPHSPANPSGGSPVVVDGIEREDAQFQSFRQRHW